MRLLYLSLFKDTFFQTVARVLTAIVNFALVLFIAKSLGSAGLGQYDKAFAFIGVFSLFVDFGINAVFLKNEKPQHLYTLIVLRLVIALLVFVIIQPIIFLMPYDSVLNTGFSFEEKIYLEILGMLFFASALSISLKGIVQLAKRFDLLIVPSVILALISFVFGLYGYFQKELIWFFIGNIFGSLAFIFILYFLIAKKVPVKFENKIDMTVLKRLIKNSLPLGAMLFLNVLYVRADVLILSFVRPTSEVGMYTLAYKFFEFPLNLSFFVMNGLYPVFLASRKDKKQFHKMVSNLLIVLFILSCIITFISFVGAPILGSIKPDFINSIIPFRILASSYPIFFLTNLLLWVLISENFDKKLPLVYLLSLILNIILNIIFIPQYGFIASAYITVFCELLILIVFMYYYSRIVKKIN